MATVSFTQLKIAAGAKTLVDSALSRVSTADQTKVKAALVAAAGQNADRYLTALEVQSVISAFDEASGAGTGVLTAEQLGTGLTLASEAIKSMGSLSNVDGVSSHFTFQESLAAKLIAELKDSVTRAAGRPMEVNMMIFEFQSDSIEKAIVDIAKANPNVTFRIVGDSGMASASGGNALPSILSHGLPNVQVKFKKDVPYSWSTTRNALVYDHNATLGLNHHKGFATFIDGAPDLLVTGSFNWSDTADTKNYEDINVFHNTDASTRRAIEQYGDELRGFFNNDDASLSPNNFYNFRRDAMNSMTVAHGGTATNFTRKADDDYLDYTAPVDARGFDVNGFRTSDRTRLAALVGSSVAKAIIAERGKYGRFASLDELKERVPSAAALSAQKLTALGQATFGSSTVSINVASSEELDNCGFSKDMAEAIVAYREKNGDFESLDDLLRVPGMTAARINFARKLLVATDVEGFFNSRPYSAAAAGTGYGAGGDRTSPVMGAEGTVRAAPASVTVGATDLFNRAKPGQGISVAMYGMSTTAPEFRALVAAARRGVTVRVVLNDEYTESTVAAIKALKEQGLPIDVRVQSAKTMHEKFGVVGDDSFSGSANFSESSSTKHSEDRIAIKNNPEVSTAYQSEFEMLWAKSNIVT